jgi:hypothetical protein
MGLGVRTGESCASRTRRARRVAAGALASGAGASPSTTLASIIERRYRGPTRAEFTTRSTRSARRVSPCSQDRLDVVLLEPRSERATVRPAWRTRSAGWRSPRRSGRAHGATSTLRAAYAVAAGTPAAASASLGISTLG